MPLKRGGVSDKASPFDWDPVPARCLDHDTRTLADNEIFAWANCCKTTGWLWISHFATCPNAPRHRKGSGNANA